MGNGKDSGDNSLLSSFNIHLECWSGGAAGRRDPTGCDFPVRGAGTLAAACPLLVTETPFLALLFAKSAAVLRQNGTGARQWALVAPRLRDDSWCVGSACLRTLQRVFGRKFWAGFLAPLQKTSFTLF